MAPAALSIRGLTVAYGSKPALFSIDASAPAGSMTAVAGPNGAGKSTLLKAALGVVPALAGRALAWGEQIDDVRDRIAYVPQRSAVDWDFPASALDVVMMGLYREMGLLRPATRRHERRALECLAEVGLESSVNEQIGELSGGQQQRVFIARALAQGADLYLLDEPLAGVDAASERAIIGVLKRLRDEGRSVVAVHHDLSTVAEHFDHAILLNVTKVAEGPPDAALCAENLRVAYANQPSPAAAELELAGA